MEHMHMVVIIIIVVSNIGTAIDYAVIGLRMVHQSTWRRDIMLLMHDMMSVMHGTFIFSCGLAHLAMGVSWLWVGHMMTWPVALASLFMFLCSTPVALLMLIRPGKRYQLNLHKYEVTVTRAT